MGGSGWEEVDRLPVQSKQDPSASKTKAQSACSLKLQACPIQRERRGITIVGNRLQSLTRQINRRKGAPKQKQRKTDKKGGLPAMKCRSKTGTRDTRKNEHRITLNSCEKAISAPRGGGGGGAFVTIHWTKEIWEGTIGQARRLRGPSSNRYKEIWSKGKLKGGKKC